MWRVMASSDGTSSWTPLKPQHSNPNSDTVANQLWCIDLLTPPTPLIIPHRLPYATQELILNPCKIVEKQSEVFHTFLWHFFQVLKQSFMAYCSSKVSQSPNCIFENHQVWQSSFSRVDSNSCYSCSFKTEIIQIDPSSHKMYSNTIVNFQVSRTIKNARIKKHGTYWMHHVFFGVYRITFE